MVLGSGAASVFGQTGLKGEKAALDWMTFPVGNWEKLEEASKANLSLAFQRENPHCTAHTQTHTHPIATFMNIFHQKNKMPCLVQANIFFLLQSTTK